MDTNRERVEGITTTKRHEESPPRDSVAGFVVPPGAPCNSSNGKTGTASTMSANWLAGLLVIAAATGGLPGAQPRQTEKETYAMKLTSPAFADGQPIPDKYTCAGADVRRR